MNANRRAVISAMAGVTVVGGGGIAAFGRSGGSMEYADLLATFPAENLGYDYGHGGETDTPGKRHWPMAYALVASAEARRAAATDASNARAAPQRRLGGSLTTVTGTITANRGGDLPSSGMPSQTGRRILLIPSTASRQRSSYRGYSTPWLYTTTVVTHSLTARRISAHRATHSGRSLSDATTTTSSGGVSGTQRAMWMRSTYSTFRRCSPDRCNASLATTSPPRDSRRRPTKR